MNSFDIAPARTVGDLLQLLKTLPENLEIRLNGTEPIASIDQHKDNILWICDFEHSPVVQTLLKEKAND